MAEEVYMVSHIAIGNTVYFFVSVTIFVDFVTWPPFCSITHLSERWPSDKVKEICATNLKVHCVMQLSLFS